MVQQAVTPLVDARPQGRVATAIALLLLGLVCLAPFVVPIHRRPQAVFEVEWLSAVLLAFLGVAVGVARRRTVSIAWPVPAWFVAVVAITALQLVLGRLVYSTQLTLACLYAFALTGAYLVGRVLAGEDLRARAATTMAQAIVLGALFSLGIQWLQLFEVKGLPWWLYFEIVHPLYKTRPFANLGQANMLSTYYVWAMLAVLYLQGRSLRPSYATVLLFVIPVGLALTRSRLGLLLSMLVIASVWVPCALRPALMRHRIHFTLALVAGYLVGAASVAAFIAYQGAGVDNVIQRFGEQGGFGVRLVLWWEALKISAMSPLLGTGFAGYASAQYVVAEATPFTQATMYAHNLVLQTAAELGWPMAILLTVLCVWWVLAQMRDRLQQPETCFAWTIVVVMFTHAQLEWPLASLHFAIPTLLLIGLGEPALAAARGGRAPVEPRLLALAGVAGLVLCVSMMLEFNELAVTGERAEFERRTKEGISEETLMRLLALSDAARLRPYSEALLVSVRGPNSVEPSEEELRRHERVIILGADPRLLVRLVILNARAGHFDAALHHAERMRVFHAQSFDTLSTSVLDSIKDLGPDADALRAYLRTRQN